MTWCRLLGPEPPDEMTMNHWESEGWSTIQVLGPCPTMDRATRKPSGAVFIVYLHRSILAPGAAVRPGWPIGRAGGEQKATDSGTDEPEGLVN